MKISENYLPYEEPTLIVVTNQEVAKIFKAIDREVDELKILTVDTEEPKERSSGTANSAPPDIDAIKQHSKEELYKNLNLELMKLIKEYKTIILCAPEVYKNEIMDALHTDVKKCTGDVIPKNLASLPLDQIIRILKEA